MFKYKVSGYLGNKGFFEVNELWKAYAKAAVTSLLDKGKSSMQVYKVQEGSEDQIIAVFVNGIKVFEER